MVCVRPGPGMDRRGGLVNPGLERTHDKPGSGKGQVKSGSGTRAGQIRNGKGRHQKERKNTRGCWFSLAAFNWGFNQGFYWAAKHVGVYLEFYVGLPALGFNLGKNLGRFPGALELVEMHSRVKTMRPADPGFGETPESGTPKIDAKDPRLSNFPLCEAP